MTLDILPLKFLKELALHNVYVEDTTALIQASGIECLYLDNTRVRTDINAKTYSECSCERISV